VISALYGVTDFLIESAGKSLGSEKLAAASVKKIKEMHKQPLQYVKNSMVREKAEFVIDDKISLLERFFFGIHYLKEISPRSLDLIQSFGERLSPIVLEAMLLDRGIDAKFIDAEEAGIHCKGPFGNAIVDLHKTPASLRKNILKNLKNKVVLLPGYYGVDENKDVKTFGRGGTDYSAGFIANILNAELEIWKDVSGFMTADPRAVKGAKQIDFLSYDEAEELGYLGAKILHPKTIEPLREKGLEAEIKNIFRPEVKGTIIGPKKRKSMEIVKSIAARKETAIVTVWSSSMVNASGFLATIFDKLAEQGIVVDLIATSETAISFSIEPQDLKKCLSALEPLKEQLSAEIYSKSGLSLIGVIGEGMRETPGIAGKVFSALGRNKINVELITQGASEINITFVVEKRDSEKAIQIVHDEFIRKR
jgi:aspartate kinase